MNNTIALKSVSSPENEVYFNNFIDNKKDVVDNSDNYYYSKDVLRYWYDGKQHFSHLGNYWSRYRNLDSDNDGIYDEKYNPSGVLDQYPLAESIEHYIYNYTNIDMDLNITTLGKFLLAKVYIKNNDVRSTIANLAVFIGDEEKHSILNVPPKSLKIETFNEKIDFCGRIKVLAIINLSNSEQKCVEKYVNISCPDLFVDDIIMYLSNKSILKGKPVVNFDVEIGCRGNVNDLIYVAAYADREIIGIKPAIPNSKVTFSYEWDLEDHEMLFMVDAANKVRETCEKNNIKVIMLKF